MMRLKQRPRSICCEHAVDGTLDRAEAEWDRRAALGVVLAAPGYPERAAQGRRDHRARRISRAPSGRRTCSTPAPRRKGDAVVTSGGRVLCVTALGESVSSPQKRGLRGDRRTSASTGMQYRSDIGFRALGRR